jgi:hypothetical protein
MPDTGPYAHLNSLSGSDRKNVAFLAMPDGTQWPMVPAQNPETGQWWLVPVDPQGYPRFDLAGGWAKSGWKVVDPTDKGALQANGIDPAGFPHDYSVAGQISDILKGLVDWGAGLIPQKPPPESIPQDGTRGEMRENGPILGRAYGTGQFVSISPNNQGAAMFGWPLEGASQGISAPIPRLRSAPRGFLDQPQNDLAYSGAVPAPSDPFGPSQPSLANGRGALPASPPQTQMRPQQVPAPSASPIDVPVPPALMPLVPFFFPQGLNTQSTQAWPSTGPADGSDTPGLYNGPLPPALSSPSGPFGGALMPGGPFAPPQPNQASDGGALAAFPSQTQTTAQQAPAAASIEALVPPALKPLVPLFFAPDGSPTDFGRGLFARGATAEMTPQADQVRTTGALSAPSGGAQMMPQQARAPSPPWIDLVPPELRILVPFFFPQGFDNG